MKMTEDINVRLDVKMKGRMLEIADEEKRDVSDVARLAFALLIAERDRKKRQPEFQLYPNG